MLVDKFNKRDNYMLECFRVEDKLWNPTPREGAALVICSSGSKNNKDLHLLFGLNSEALTEVNSA